MKKLLLLLLLSQTTLSFCQVKLTEMEKKYKDSVSEAKTDTIIKGRVNRGVKPEDTNTFLIEYNFKTGIYTRNLLDLKINTPVVFRITNINRLAYDVKVTPRDSILADTGWEDGILEFLKENSLPTTVEAKAEENKIINNSNNKSLEKEDLKKGANENVVTNLNTILYTINLDKETLERNLEKNRQDKEFLKDSNFKLLKDHPKIDNEIDAVNEEMKKLSQDTTSKDQKKTEIEEKKIKLTLIKSDIESNKTKLEKLNNDIIRDSSKIKIIEDKLKKIDSSFKYIKIEYDTYASTFAKLKDAYFKILQINDCYNEVRLRTSNPLLSDKKYIEDHEKKIVDRLKSLFPSINNDYQKFLETYIQLGHEFYALSLNEKVLELDSGGQSKFLEPAKNMKTLADNWNEEFKKADIAALIHEMNRAFELLRDADVYTYTSKPIQPVKDVVIFDIKIKKNNQDKPDYNNNREFSYKEYTKGGMRFDAGIGFAISYFDDASQYEIVPDAAGNDKITLKEKNLWVPSFIGMFTAGFRSNKLASFGISAGLGVSANDGKLQLNNFYVGPSLTLGRENRICFATGITVKGMSELKKGVAVGTEVSNTNEISSFTNSIYNFGPFLSITYNLTKGIKNNVKYFYKK